ncbi:MAG: DUF2200 domain-containing protein [Flavobacteriaceae bacterium]
MAKSDTSHHDDRLAKMSFASVFPHYVTKIEKKGRTKQELFTIIEWLTGFNEYQILEHIKNNLSFEDFFNQAKLNPSANLIRGVICGYRVEDISNRITRNVRYLDKIVDELSKGKSIEKICRVPKS